MSVWSQRRAFGCCAGTPPLTPPPHIPSNTPAPPQSLKPTPNAGSEKGPNLGPDALSHKQRTSSFVTKFKFEGEAFLGMSHHAMAAILDLHVHSCISRAHTVLRTQWAREKGEAKSRLVPLTQRERQVSLLTGCRPGRSPVLSPHSGDLFLRLPPRPAKWFTLC